MSNAAPKTEWRKAEKTLYLPKTEPEVIDVPTMNFITITGEGNPNAQPFADRISTLYPVAYAIKMTLKRFADAPAGYCDYTVYPLEGHWDINDEAKKRFTGTFNKDDFVYKLMIRQPEFVTEAFFNEMVMLAQHKDPANALFSEVKFENITEGRCVQMLHIGSYDDEPASFDRMESFATDNGLIRLSKAHREIYLTDFRKVPTDKLKTVLRFQIAGD